MSNQNYHVWIEAEQWEPDEWNPVDCNSDIIVSFKNDGEWAATFFTYKNILSLAEKNSLTGECLQGKYFWASDTVLVDEITRSRVEEVIINLIEVGEFEKVFTVSE